MNVSPPFSGVTMEDEDHDRHLQRLENLKSRPVSEVDVWTPQVPIFAKMSFITVSLPNYKLMQHRTVVIINSS
jgi:hypothetical protein